MPSFFTYGSRPRDETSSSISKQQAAHIELLLSRSESIRLPGRRDAHAQREGPGSNIGSSSMLDDLLASTEALWGERAAMEKYMRAQRGELQELRAVADRRGDAVAQLRRELDGAEARHALQVRGLRDRVDQLLGDMLAGQAGPGGGGGGGGGGAWTDEMLKLRWRGLQRLVNDLTSPHRLCVRGSDAAARARADPGGFLSGADDRFHYPLKNAIWTILGEYFFAKPFGFGALGPGDGGASLRGVYESWRKLFGGSDEMASLEHVFLRDKEANKWRSATFESIAASISNSDTDDPSEIRRQFEQNLGEATGAILGLLADVSGEAPVAGVQDLVQQVAGSAAQLGLQFGVQPARLQLIVPRRGDQVSIGTEYYDCEDADSNKGSAVAVDLVVLPGLNRVGNGRDDMSTKLTLIPCEIYPRAE